MPRVPKRKRAATGVLPCMRMLKQKRGATGDWRERALGRGLTFRGLCAMMPLGGCWEVRAVKKRGNRPGNPDYVEALDGFRALGALLVLAFHFWQQSWVGPHFTVLGHRVDFTNIVVNGSLGVELLFLLSGFCLYYPLAMHPERRLSLGHYAYKRAVRILPGYLLCVLACSAWQIGRLDPAVLRSQFLANMTFTQMMTPALAYNRINGPLWSIAVEIQFYILFPLLAKPFRRHPYGVAAAAFAVGEAWRWYLRDVDYSRIGFLMNQLPGMIDVFVGGMLAAHIAAQFRRGLDEEKRRALSPAFTVGALAFLGLWLVCAKYMGRLRYADIPENMSRMQLDVRKWLILGFGGAMACSALASKGFRAVMGNRVARFLSGISYQIYLWHAWIALRLKDLRIPAYATERPMDDAAWRMPYLLLCIAVTMAVAIALTYGFEKPVSRFCLNHMPRWARPRRTAEEKEASHAEG